MLSKFGSFFTRKSGSKPKGGPLIQEFRSEQSRPQRRSRPQGQTFTKIFRWTLPAGQTQEPNSVEVVGSFSQWKPVSLVHDSRVGSWHAAVHHIPGNRTHHYMYLVDGEPWMDRDCDGLAVPHGPDEERYALETSKGPRVFMLFAQTK